MPVKLETAILTNQLWLSPVKDTYARGLLCAAVQLAHAGVHHFNAFDVPKRLRPSDPDTAGAVVRMMLDQGIIVPLADRQRYHRKLYRLTHAALAPDWLKALGFERDNGQEELFAFKSEYQQKPYKGDEQ